MRNYTASTVVFFLFNGASSYCNLNTYLLIKENYLAILTHPKLPYLIHDDPHCHDGEGLGIMGGTIGVMEGRGLS